MNNIVKTGVYVKNGEEHKFNFYTSLRAINKIKFVNFVTESLIGDNYYSLLRNMMFDIAIVHIFTDVDVSGILESDNAIDMIEDFLDENNIVEIVKANVNYGVIEELNQSVDSNIEYRTGIHRNLIAESLSSLMNVIENKISDIDTEKMMEMAQVISSVSGELTADKVLEAYSKSDLFKQKYAQIMEDRKQHDNNIESSANEIKKSRSRSKVAR